MNVEDWLAKVAYIGKSDIEGDELSDIYYSKFDASYITRVGMESNIKHLAKRNITEELTHGVGFSPKDNKWYGWTHRGIFGFTIGSKCKKESINFIGSTIEEQEEAAIEFWKCELYSDVYCDGIIEKDGDKFFDVKWKYNDLAPNTSLRNTIGGCLHLIIPLGHGEWTALTMKDAKQMAIDYNSNLS